MGEIIEEYGGSIVMMCLGSSVVALLSYMCTLV